MAAFSFEAKEGSEIGLDEHLSMVRKQRLQRLSF